MTKTRKKGSKDSRPALYLTVAETAQRLGVSTRTVYQWIRDGELSAERIGPRLWRVREDKLPGGV